MIEGIKAVAFDIDGTLYPSWRLYIRMGGYFFKNLLFYRKFNKVRGRLHRTAPLPDFFEYQSILLSEETGLPVKEARQKIRDICYDGLMPFFRKVKPFHGMYESILALKKAGLKIAILSDFPPEQKEDIWGVRDLCDVCIGSEESGALKPSIYPFGILAKKLELAPHEILYVGNSIKYDVLGAKHAGMKAAYIMTGLRRIFSVRCKHADFSFKNYRKLTQIVLE